MIRYITTDLDVTSANDLTALAAAFERQGVFTVQIIQREDGVWDATFETSKQHDRPDATIVALLDVIESLAEPLRHTWRGCARCAFHIGYDCLSTPRSFVQELSNDLLRRVAETGASLRVTVYPRDRPPR